MSQWELRIITPLAASHPEPGRLFWALEDMRVRTRNSVSDLSQSELDWTAPGVENSIGSLLYYIALIEFDYLCVDILGGDYLEGFADVLPIPDRDSERNLSAVHDVPIEEHLARLDNIRGHFLSHVSPLSAEQVQAARPLPDSNYEISPAWTLLNLMQHEAEHRGQISTIRAIHEAWSSEPWVNTGLTPTEHLTRP